MYYYLYKITSLIPDKPYYYIGIHKTKNLNDGYFGGGVKWTKLYKKIGREKLRKEILRFFDNYSDLLEGEKKAIGHLYETDPWCCNISPGGIYNPMQGRHHSPETIEKIRKANIGKVVSKETGRLISEKQKGKIIPLEVRLRLSKTLRGRKMSESFKENKRGAKNSMYGKHFVNVLCPYCGREIPKPSYVRWHGENCKMKDEKGK